MLYMHSLMSHLVPRARDLRCIQRPGTRFQLDGGGELASVFESRQGGNAYLGAHSCNTGSSGGGECSKWERQSALCSRFALLQYLSRGTTAKIVRSAKIDTKGAMSLPPPLSWIAES